MKVHTVDSAAEVLQLHKRTVFNLLRSKEIKARKVGNKWRISEKALEEYLMGDDQSEKEETKINTAE